MSADGRVAADTIGDLVGHLLVGNANAGARSFYLRRGYAVRSGFERLEKSLG